MPSSGSCRRSSKRPERLADDLGGAVQTTGSPARLPLSRSAEAPFKADFEAGILPRRSGKFGDRTVPGRASACLAKGERAWRGRSVRQAKCTCWCRYPTCGDTPDAGASGVTGSNRRFTPRRNRRHACNGTRRTSPTRHMQLTRHTQRKQPTLQRIQRQVRASSVASVSGWNGRGNILSCFSPPLAVRLRST